MADVDSLNDQNSDLEQDPSAMDADAEDDETPQESQLGGAKKKNKKKKKKSRSTEATENDSDSQPADDSLDSVEQDDEAESNAVGPPTTVIDGDTVEVNDDSIPGAEDLTEQVGMGKLQTLQKAMELLSMQQQQPPVSTPKTMEEAQRKEYQFWDTQPVPKLDETVEIEVNHAIEPSRPVEEVRQEAYSLPSGFVWCNVDISKEGQLEELYTLLNENYVEDDDNMFRFDYSPEFLQWALKPPGWLKDWHCGVRVAKSGKLIGFISAIPAHIKIYDLEQKMVEINFLCVHKKLRSKRVAPVLIREITRRVHLQGIFQAVYTAGVVLPRPVSSCRYWHRSLNPRKLIDVKFSHLSRNMTMQRTLKLYRLPEAVRTPGFRELKKKDVKAVHKLMTEYLKKFDMAPMFTEDEFRHWFLPKQGIVNSFCVEKDGKMTDFVSFYTLPSTVMHHPVHKSLQAAYSFYNCSTRTPWPDLMQDALIIAKAMHFDVFNALDLMDNKEFLEKLKFGIGDGNLQYYIYNWKCPVMEPNQVGLVLQ